MVMSIITYARLEHFIDFETVNAHYQSYMEKSQRQGINERQEYYYNTDSLSSRESGADKVPGTVSKITFSLILNKDKRVKSEQLFQQHLSMAKNLMRVLYKGEPFFKEAEENPHLLDRLLQELMDSVDSREKPISRLGQLERVELPSGNLNDMLYYMLQGTARNGSGERKRALNQGEEAEEESEEYFQNEGGLSLLRFITLKPGPKIRIALAPREVLEAIYGERAPIVEKILVERNNLTRDVNNDKIAADVANQKFKDMFLQQVPNGLSDEVLDFTIKKKQNSTGVDSLENKKTQKKKGNSKGNNAR